MYNRQKPKPSTIVRKDTLEGETIEKKVRRIMNNKEPITDGAPIVYTERKEGVLPAYDIRTDRFEIAIEAFEKIDKSNKAKREERHKSQEQKDSEKRAAEAKKGMEKEGGDPANTSAQN